MSTQEPAGTPTAAGDPTGAAGPVGGDVDEIRADIERTRAELGDSVEALAAKADVKTRARQAARTATTRARDRVTAGAHAAGQRAGSLAGATADAAKRARVTTPQQLRQVGETARRRPAPAAGTAAGVAAAVATAVLIARRRAAKRADSAGEPDVIRPDTDLDRPQPGATIDALAASGDVKTLARLTARAATIRAADNVTSAAQAVSQWAGQLARMTADVAQRVKVTPPPQARQTAETEPRRLTPMAWTAGVAAVAATVVLIRRRRTAKLATAGDGSTGGATSAGTVGLDETAADIGLSRPEVDDGIDATTAKPGMRARARQVASRGVTVPRQWLKRQRMSSRRQ